MKKYQVLDLNKIWNIRVTVRGAVDEVPVVKPGDLIHKSKPHPNRFLALLGYMKLIKVKATKYDEGRYFTGFDTLEEYLTGTRKYINPSGEVQRFHKVVVYTDKQEVDLLLTDRELGDILLYVEENKGTSKPHMYTILR